MKNEDLERKLKQAQESVFHNARKLSRSAKDLVDVKKSGEYKITKSMFDMIVGPATEAPKDQEKSVDKK